MDGAWLGTAVFGLLGLVTLAAAFVDRRRPLLVTGHLFHVAMAATMIGMSWGAIGLWTAPIAILFGLAAAWFVALAVLRSSGRLSRRRLGGHGLWHQVGHAVMMLAMVWMTLAMAQTQSPEEHHHGGASLPVAVALPGIAATAALIVTGVLLSLEVIDCLRGSRAVRRHAADLAGAGGMSLAMAGICWSILAT